MRVGVRLCEPARSRRCPHPSRSLSKRYPGHLFDNRGNSERREQVMGVVFRKRQKFGPLVLNFTENGFSSWTIKVGRWSWNSRARAHRVDLPGPISWKQDKSRA